jgi:hypothetical protein
LKPECAAAAIEKMNEKEVGNSKLVVKEYQPSNPALIRHVYIANLAPEVKEDDLKEWCKAWEPERVYFFLFIFLFVYFFVNK